MLWEKADNDPIDGRRDVRDVSRLRTVRGWSARDGWLVSRAGATPVTLPVGGPCVADVCELRLEFERFRRADWERIEVLKAGDVRAPSGSLSVEVEDPVDATDAVCWRSRDNSRVNRLIYGEIQ